MDEPWTNRIVPMLFFGSPAHFSNRNSFTPPSLPVQCSSPLIAADEVWVTSFITRIRTLLEHGRGRKLLGRAVSAKLSRYRSIPRATAPPRHTGLSCTFLCTALRVETFYFQRQFAGF